MLATREAVRSRRESGPALPDETVELTLAWPRGPARSKLGLGTSVHLVSHGTYVLRAALWRRNYFLRPLSTLG